jgi:hypothetical protein
VVLLLAVGALLVVLAPPALAHGRGSDATNFDSRITAVPDLPGVTWRVYGGDELLGVENRTDQELVVLGYEGEPYLRIGPDGVWENQRSPATYLNRDRFGQVAVPPDAAADAEADWAQLGTGNSHAWHDHRIHWMSPAMPPAVVDADAEVLVQPWAVEVAFDGVDHTVTGELWWVPGPAVWPWLLAALLLTLPALAGVRPAALVLGAVALLNLVGLVDDVAAVPQPLATAALAGVQTLLYSGLGLFAAFRAWRGDYGGFVALGFGAGLVALGQGLLVLDVLGASQLATLFPAVLTRAAVALSLAQVVPVGVVAYLGARRLAPEAEPQGEGATP